MICDFGHTPAKQVGVEETNTAVNMTSSRVLPKAEINRPVV